MPYLVAVSLPQHCYINIPATSHKHNASTLKNLRTLRVGKIDKHFVSIWESSRLQSPFIMLWKIIQTKKTTEPQYIRRRSAHWTEIKALKVSYF